MPFGNRIIIFEDLFSSVLSEFTKYHPSENQQCNNLGVFQSLKLRILTVKTLRKSLRLFTPNALGG